jgi:hypothetical protein
MEPFFRTLHIHRRGRFPESLSQEIIYTVGVNRHIPVSFHQIGLSRNDESML